MGTDTLEIGDLDRIQDDRVGLYGRAKRHMRSSSLPGERRENGPSIRGTHDSTSREVTVSRPINAGLTAV